MSSSKQQLVLSIIDFLKTSVTDGTVPDADAESLEVAIQIIGEAFQTEGITAKPAALLPIFDVYLKTKAARAPAAPAAAPVAPPKEVTEEDRSSAETFKAAGNAEMAKKDFVKAIESYGKAIELDGTNPVYYSNRAAAHSSKGDHLSAVEDAQQAIVVNPKFVKAYHRLGHAQYSLSDFKAAATSFKQGLEFDPTNANLRSGLTNSEARIPEDDDDDEAPPSLEATRGAGAGAGAGAGGMPDLSALAGLMGGGGGGMPDMASMMSNPMVQNMMASMQANGGMESLMSNPAVMNMMNRMQSGGGMPDMTELMSDPTMRNLATQFGAGGMGQPGPR